MIDNRYTFYKLQIHKVGDYFKIGILEFEIALFQTLSRLKIDLLSNFNKFGN